MRRLTFFLAAVFSVLFAEKALCHGTTFAIEPESFNSFRYEEMRVEDGDPLSIRRGRFLSVDPTWDSADLGKPQSWNRYSYVWNNPVNATDPDGRLGFLTNDPEVLRQRHEKIIGTAAKLFADFVLPDGHSDNSTTADKPDLEAAAATGAVVTIGKNAATGKLGEKIVAEQLVAEGKTILGSQVSAQTSQGRRVIDHLVQDATGISAKEVKTGNAVRSAAQVTKDIAMATEGARLVGKNAPTGLKGKFIRIVTEVIKVLE